MKFSFKKIGSVLASSAMLMSTVALAAAANFPAPYVKSSGADVAIIHGGSKAAYTDLVAVTDISSYLSSELARLTGTSGGGTTNDVTGEAYPLFTSSSELFMNSSLKSVRETMGNQQLATVLADGTFEGTTSVKYTQKIIMGTHPSITFAQQPSDDDDPQVGIAIGTAPKTQSIYNATVTFDNPINFSTADSIGEELVLFGQKYTVGAATTGSKLVLFKSSKKIDLSSDTNPAEIVNIDGKEYTIELVAASDTDATIKVTDSAGSSDQKAISEASSKKIKGLEVSVDTADENNFRLTASVSVGSNRLTLQDGNSIKVGTDEDVIDGTNVEFAQTNDSETTHTGVIGKLIFQTAAIDNQNDAIVPGQSYVDPIFGSFKVDFTGISIPVASTDREEIKVQNSGNDKMTVTFMSHESTEAQSVYWNYNKSDSDGGGGQDLADNNGDPIKVSEMAAVNQSQYFVLANKDEGGLYEVTQIRNSSSTAASDDEITLKNVMTGDSKTYKADSEGSGSFTEQGKTVTFTYYGDSTASNSAAMRVRFQQAESGGQSMLLYPTIKTKSGAKVAFYEPLTISLNDWNGLSNGTVSLNPITGFTIPNGDGYTSVTVAHSHTLTLANETYWNVTFGTTLTTINTSIAGGSASGAVGKFTYNITTTATVNQSIVYLVSPQGGNIVRPSIMVFEEKDEDNDYEGFVFTTDVGYDGDSAGVGVSDIVRTWGADAQMGNEIQLETNSDKYQDMDFWGTLFELDKSDSDQTTGRISYPDNQVEATVYVAEESASITAGGGSTGSTTSLGSVSVPDTQASSVSGKNLIVVGGSCVNNVAADLLGVSSPTCGAGFTAKTGVGSGQYLIETFARTGDKVATLVAGFEASDTTNAAKALTTKKDIATTVGMKYTGKTSTDISAVIASA